MRLILKPWCSFGGKRCLPRKTFLKTLSSPKLGKSLRICLTFWTVNIKSFHRTDGMEHTALGAANTSFDSFPSFLIRLSGALIVVAFLCSAGHILHQSSFIFIYFMTYHIVASGEMEIMVWQQSLCSSSRNSAVPFPDLTQLNQKETNYRQCTWNNNLETFITDDKTIKLWFNTFYRLFHNFYCGCIGPAAPQIETWLLEDLAAAQIPDRRVTQVSTGLKPRVQRHGANGPKLCQRDRLKGQGEVLALRFKAAAQWLF